MPEERAGRRAYDHDLDPVVETYVQKELTRTRHGLRGEFTIAMQAIETRLIEIQKQQVESSLTATREHADVRADIAELRHCIEPIPALVEKVDELDEHDTIDTTRQQDRDQLRVALRWWAMAVIAAIGTATGLILAFNH